MLINTWKTLYILLTQYVILGGTGFIIGINYETMRLNVVLPTIIFGYIFNVFILIFLYKK